MQLISSLLVALFTSSISISSSLASPLRARGVSGSAFGYAAGTTGGGNSAPVTPTTTSELVSYLTDSSPRVILLDRSFDFRQGEGRCENCAGCIPTSYSCGSKGQLAIDAAGWCQGKPYKAVSYARSATNPIQVKSNKSIIGVGNKGIIKGKGLRMVKGVSNIIIQNILITQLNQDLIWGGDAITLDGASKIWIDHVTTSLIGRQHIVLGYGANQGVTISNHHFDGRTTNSASCDGRHYWTLLMYGSSDYITIFGSHFDSVSGRSPEVKYQNRIHMLSNLWSTNGNYDHSITVSGINSAHILVEGNIFDNDPQPYKVDPENQGYLYAQTSNSNACQGVFRRDCLSNAFLHGSKAFNGNDVGIVGDFRRESYVQPIGLNQVENYVKSHAGFGKI